MYITCRLTRDFLYSITVEFLPCNIVQLVWWSASSPTSIKSFFQSINIQQNLDVIYWFLFRAHLLQVLFGAGVPWLHGCGWYPNQAARHMRRLRSMPRSWSIPGYCNPLLPLWITWNVRELSGTTLIAVCTYHWDLAFAMELLSIDPLPNLQPSLLGFIGRGIEANMKCHDAKACQFRIVSRGSKKFKIGLNYNANCPYPSPQRPEFERSGHHPAHTGETERITSVSVWLFVWLESGEPFGRNRDFQLDIWWCLGSCTHRLLPVACETLCNCDCFRFPWSFMQMQSSESSLARTNVWFKSHTVCNLGSFAWSIVEFHRFALRQTDAKHWCSRVIWKRWNRLSSLLLLSLFGTETNTWPRWDVDNRCLQFGDITVASKHLNERSINWNHSKIFFL